MILLPIRVATVVRNATSACPEIIKSHANRVLLLPQTAAELAARNLSTTREGVEMRGIALLLEPNERVREELPAFYLHWLTALLEEQGFYYIGYEGAFTRFKHGRLCRYAVVLAYLQHSSRNDAVTFKKEVARLLVALLRRHVLEGELPKSCRVAAIRTTDIGKRLTVQRGHIVIGGRVRPARWSDDRPPSDATYTITAVETGDSGDASVDGVVDVTVPETTTTTMLVNPLLVTPHDVVRVGVFKLADEVARYFVSVREGTVHVNTRARPTSVAYAPLPGKHAYRVLRVDVDAFGRAFEGGRVALECTKTKDVLHIPNHAPIADQ